MNKKVCIIALSWGDSYKWYHGDSNLALAQRSKILATKYQVHVIAQWEIADHLKGFYWEQRCRGIGIPEWKSRIDTYFVLEQAKEMMSIHGCTHAILVAHEVHMPRVKLVAQKLNIAIEEHDTVFEKEIPYDKNSTQWHTVNERVARPYEYLATRWYRFIGKI